jgi:BTB/POZ domain-containing protein KCTD9
LIIYSKKGGDEMSQKIKDYLDKVFAPYEDIKAIQDIKEELYTDLQEKFKDLQNEGYAEEIAFNRTIESIGEISELVESINAKTRDLQQLVGMDFSKSNLENSDLKAVNLRNGKFTFSNMAGSDFSHSTLQGTNFDYSNLEKSDFRNSDLSGTSFKCANLEYSKFDGANLTEAKITKSNLKGASLKDCIFDGTDFSYTNLAEVCFDNLTFNGTIFNHSSLKRTSFRNAILKNVSFKSDVKYVIFDGARMDKLTYTLLKGYKANLENVTVI